MTLTFQRLTNPPPSPTPMFYGESTTPYYLGIPRHSRKPTKPTKPTKSSKLRQSNGYKVKYTNPVRNLLQVVERARAIQLGRHNQKSV